jgi:hypothetical protein
LVPGPQGEFGPGSKTPRVVFRPGASAVRAEFAQLNSRYMGLGFRQASRWSLVLFTRFSVLVQFEDFAQ